MTGSMLGTPLVGWRRPLFEVHLMGLSIAVSIDSREKKDVHLLGWT